MIQIELYNRVRIQKGKVKLIFKNPWDRIVSWLSGYRPIPTMVLDWSWEGGDTWVLQKPIVFTSRFDAGSITAVGYQYRQRGFRMKQFFGGKRWCCGKGAFYRLEGIKIGFGLGKFSQAFSIEVTQDGVERLE